MPDVVGWLVEEGERPALLARFKPAYPEVVAHHVTLKARAPKDEPLPAGHSGEIVGVADDGAGVQALVVRIGGTTDRWDGSTCHITWSLGPGRRAKESNDVIRERGFTPCDPVPVTLRPARF